MCLEEAPMATKNKIPKKLFGVKIPKVLRSDTLIKSLLNSPIGRQIIANALVAAAGAAAAALVAGTDRPAAKGRSAAADAGEEAAKLAKRALKSAAGALTDTLSSAAKSALGEDERPRPRLQRAARTH
jgi:hypothetical protein